MFWKAHDDTISKISAVEHPPSIISCSHDCLTKVWSIEGFLLGVIDSNNPKPSLGLKGGWGFVPSADKGQKSHRHRKEENFAELVDAVHVDNKGIAEAHAMQHNGKVLRRHQSQENFLNRQLHKGQRLTTNGEFLEDAFKSSKLKFIGKYNRRTSWNPMDAKMQIEAERERGEIEELYRGAESKQWDGMMDSLHIFESALGEHTKNRRGNSVTIHDSVTAPRKGGNVTALLLIRLTSGFMEPTVLATAPVKSTHPVRRARLPSSSSALPSARSSDSARGWKRMK